MTKSNIGKVFIGMVLLAGSARAGQWQFARESTLVPAGPDEVVLGIQTLRVHSPVEAAAATTMRVEIINADQQVVGHLIAAKSSAVPAERANAPEEMIELVFQGRRVNLHFKDRAIWISDGRTSASASFDRTNVEDVERVKAFADDLRLMGGIQIAAKAAVQAAAAPAASTVRPTTQASVIGALGLERIARVVPASWSAWFKGSASAPPEDDAACYTDTHHAKCAGGFGASRSSGCAYAQQQANNDCAAASGYCYGCCAWIGTGCDCACMFGDLACMCESCGGLCGPGGIAPSAGAGGAAKH